jgi:hypothetical protein
MSLKDNIASKYHCVEDFITTKLNEIKSELDEQHHIDYEANRVAFEDKWKKKGKLAHSLEHVAGKVSHRLEHEIEEQFQADYMAALEAFQRRWKDEVVA